MFLYAHFVSTHQTGFFIIPVNKVWHALFHPKYILLSLAIGVQQMQLQSPPNICIRQLVLTQKTAMLLSMFIFKQKFIF